MPRLTDTEPQETSMTTQTNDTTWRDFDDRDAYQDRLAVELTAESDQTDW
jgi:hypothetical protein